MIHITKTEFRKMEHILFVMSIKHTQCVNMIQT